MRVTVAVLLCLAATLAAPLVPRAVAATAEGRINGTVTNSAGVALPGIRVSAYRARAGSWDSASTGVTGPNGRFELDGLTDGDYRVGFAGHVSGHPVGAHSPYLLEYWDDAAFFANATSISVVAGGPVSVADAQLATGSHITGTVTGGGQPLQGVAAVAYAWDGQVWRYHSTDESDALGHYDLDDLASGTYRVGFELYYSGYAHLPQYWGDATTLEDATDIEVGSESVVPGVDVDLPEGGRITGRVTGLSGAPLPGIDVEVISRATGQWKYFTEVRTDSQGRYQVVGLPTEDYLLRFRDWQNHYIEEFWDDAASLQDATSFPVTEGETASGMDAQLAASPPEAFDLIRPPAVVGAPRAGEVLMAASGQWEPAPALSYRWIIDGVPVPDVTGREFTPRTQDVGQMVQVEVTGVRDRFITHTVLSEAVGPVAAARPSPPALPPLTATQPPIIAIPQVGRPVTMSPGSWNVGLARLTYQWLRDGVPIAGATTQTYTPAPGDLRRSLQAEVTAWQNDGTTATAHSARALVRPGTITRRERPSLRGRAATGTRLRLDTGTWLPGSVTTRVQWYAGSKAIAGATSTSLRLTRALARTAAGTRLRARLRISTPGYITVTRTLTAPGKVRTPRQL